MNMLLKEHPQRAQLSKQGSEVVLDGRLSNPEDLRTYGRRSLLR